MPIYNRTALKFLCLLMGITLSGSPSAFAQQVKPGDFNPGAIPTTILDNVQDVDFEKLGGHKVYAGESKKKSTNFLYTNIDFYCDGTGEIEAYPNSRKSVTTKGKITWKVLDDKAGVAVAVTEYTEGQFLSGDAVDVGGRVESPTQMSVTNSYLEALQVTQIIQYQDCASGESASAQQAASNGVPAGFLKNPGAVPSSILAELSTLDLVDLGGKKIFAGPGRHGATNYEYFNVDFNCDGTGTVEAYPYENMKRKPIILDTIGSITWELRKDKRRATITVVQSEGSMVFTKEVDIKWTGYERGTMSINASTLENSVISRIVEHTKCG